MKRRTEPGFTLLEVLAAVAILGIWFAVLANVAIQGLRKEGENERRIRASLIADRYLTDLELGFDVGELPEEEEAEFEEDEFLVRVVTGPLTGIELAEGVELPAEDSELAGFLAGSLESLLQDVYAIGVTVQWTEGVGERTVRRTTYYWDNGPMRESLGEGAFSQIEEAEDEETPDDGGGTGR